MAGLRPHFSTCSAVALAKEDATPETLLLPA